MVVWVDSFTDALDAERLDAVLAVLGSAGFAPSVLRRAACCGLPWITTGQRDHAARLLRHSLELLHPIVAAGTPIVGLEPSCVAVWRDDAADLVDDTRLSADVAAGVRTLAEVLVAADWEPPDLAGLTVVAQPHCHHASVIGWEADAALLARTGATVVTVSGCCGLAGNFGVERGHYETSVAVAEPTCCPPSKPPGRTPFCSPTDSRAGSNSPTSPDAEPSPSPNCSPSPRPPEVLRPPSRTALQETALTPERHQGLTSASTADHSWRTCHHPSTKGARRTQQRGSCGRAMLAAGILDGAPHPARKD